MRFFDFEVHALFPLGSVYTRPTIFVNAHFFYQFIPTVYPKTLLSRLFSKMPLRLYILV